MTCSTLVKEIDKTSENLNNMKTHQYTLKLTTPGRGFIDISEKVIAFTKQTAVTTGLCNVFLHHTSASLIICENSDPVVQEDLERFITRLVPDGDEIYQHIAEGHDDMPSHVRTVLTQNSISFPIIGSRLGLGTWQGIYIWEHRLRPHERTVTVTIQG